MKIHFIWGNKYNVIYWILKYTSLQNKLLTNTDLDGAPGTRAFVPINYQLARYGEHDFSGTDVPPNAALATRN